MKRLWPFLEIIIVNLVKLFQESLRRYTMENLSFCNVIMKEKEIR